MDKSTFLRDFYACWNLGVFDIHCARQQSTLVPVLSSQCLAELVACEDFGLPYIYSHAPDTPLKAWVLMRKQREGSLTVTEQAHLINALKYQLTAEERHPLCRRFDELFPLCGAFLRTTPLNIFAWQNDPGPALLDEAEAFVMLVSGGCWYQYQDNPASSCVAHSYEQEGVFEYVPLLAFLLTELLSYYRPGNDSFLFIASMDFPLTTHTSYLLSWQRMITAHLFEVLPVDELIQLSQSLPVSLLTYLQHRYAGFTRKQHAMIQGADIKPGVV